MKPLPVNLTMKIRKTMKSPRKARLYKIFLKKMNQTALTMQFPKNLHTKNTHMKQKISSPHLSLSL